MKWEIRGTRNGKPGQWKLEAGSADDARKKATGAGVIVQRVMPFEAPLPEPQTVPAPMPPPLWQEPAFVNPPPIRPVLPPTSYSAEKDSVIWLIGGIAILLALWICGPQLNLSSPTQLGYLLGTFVGACVVVLLPGLIVAKLVGKRPVPARTGFSVAAFLVLVVTALGEQHLRQHNIEDATSMGQAMLSEARAAVHAGPSSPHASANPSAPTMNDLSASEAADAKLLIAEVQKFVHEAKTAGEGWTSRTRAIVGQGIIRPQDLDSADHIASTKERLKQLQQVVDDRAQGTDAMYSSLPNRLRALPIGSVMKESALAGYAEKGKTTQEITHQVTEVDRQFITAATDLADFMEGRLGHFKVEGKSILFENNADVAAYNAGMARVRQAIATEGELTAKQQKLVQESSDTMEQFIRKK